MKEKTKKVFYESWQLEQFGISDAIERQMTAMAPASMPVEAVLRVVRSAPKPWLPLIPYTIELS